MVGLFAATCIHHRRPSAQDISLGVASPFGYETTPIIRCETSLLTNSAHLSQLVVLGYGGRTQALRHGASPSSAVDCSPVF